MTAIYLYVAFTAIVCSCIDLYTLYDRKYWKENCPELERVSKNARYIWQMTYLSHTGDE